MLGMWNMLSKRKYLLDRVSEVAQKSTYRALRAGLALGGFKVEFSKMVLQIQTGICKLGELVD